MSHVIVRSLHAKHRTEAEWKRTEKHLRDLTYPLYLYLAKENAKTSGTQREKGCDEIVTLGNRDNIILMKYRSMKGMKPKMKPDASDD